MRTKMICRLSGTGAEGATLRLYLERYRTDNVQEPIDTMLALLARASLGVIGTSGSLWA